MDGTIRNHNKKSNKADNQQIYGEEPIGASGVDLSMDESNNTEIEGGSNKKGAFKGKSSSKKSE